MIFKIHIINTCSAMNYEHMLEVDKYKASVSLSGIIVKYNHKSLIIPLANIAAIEEE